MSHSHADHPTSTSSSHPGHDATRSFRSPSGRAWMAYLFPGGAEPAPSRAAVAVLRFRSGDLVLELSAFPADWLQLPDEALIELARRAQPPKPRAL